MEERLVVCSVSGADGSATGYNFKVRGATSDEQAFWRVAVYFVAQGMSVLIAELVHNIRVVTPPEEMPPGTVIELGPEY